MRALVLLAVVALAAPALAGKPKRPAGPERLSLFDARGDLRTDLWGEPDQTLQAQVDRLLGERAPFARALADEKLSLVLVDLSDPSHLAAAAVRPDWETFPASLGKIAILLGVVNKARETHQPEQLVTLRPAMDRMIKASSNEDASALFAWVGHEAIVAAVKKHGLYDEKAGGLWWTPSAPFPKSPREQLRIAATARQVARYFLMMEQGRLVSPEDSRLIKAVFHNAGLALFSKGIQKRFGDTDYYGKPGILGKEIAEGMLIEAPGARYIVAIVMKGLDKDDPAFQEFGQALHALMLDRARGAALAPPSPGSTPTLASTATAGAAPQAASPPPAATPSSSAAAATPSSATPSSATPSSATPSSATPSSATPSSATLSSATPSPAPPSSATPAGGSPAAAASVTSASVSACGLRVTGGTLQLLRPDGGVAASIRPEVHVQWKQGASEDAREPRWESADGGYRAVLSTGGARWDLDATAAGMTATVTWTQPGAVEAAWVELPFSAKSARMLDGAYRVRPPPVRADALSPQVAWIDELTFLGRAQGLSLAASGGQARLRLEADLAATHPFKQWSECVKEATDKPIVTRPPLIDRSAREVSPGEQLSVSAQWLPEARAVPVLLRYPNGFRAAMVLTDHADQASVLRLGALMYGKSTSKAPLASRGGAKGLANHHLTLTKAVFSLESEGYAAQLEDPRFVELLKALRADGVEVASHSASGDPDSPQRTAAGLEVLAPFQPVTWIDHQPTTNCEALTNSGRAETLKLLEARGFRFAWSGDDDHRKELNLFEPKNLKPIAPPLYQHPLTGPLWLFSSRWMALERPVFLERMSEAALQRLEDERGLSIAHTYLDIFIEQSGTRLDQWALLEKVPGGYQLTDEADAVFARLAKHQQRGRLWVTTLRELAGHLIAVSEVRPTLERDAVVFHSSRAVKGVSVLMPDGQVQVLDLAAGETRLPLAGESAPTTSAVGR